MMLPSIVTQFFLASTAPNATVSASSPRACVSCLNSDWLDLEYSSKKNFISYLAPELTSKSNFDATLSQLSYLDEGWDGYEGKVPNEDAISDAKACLSMISARCDTLSISPLSNGDIAFYWRNGSLLAEMEFDGTGLANFLIGNVDSVDPEIRTISMPIRRDLILNALSDFFSIS